MLARTWILNRAFEGSNSLSWKYLAAATQAVLRAGAIQREHVGRDIEVRHKGRADVLPSRVARGQAPAILRCS